MPVGDSRTDWVKRTVLVAVGLGEGDRRKGRADGRERGLAVPVDDTCAVQVVGRELAADAITRQDADTEAATASASRPVSPYVSSVGCFLCHSVACSYASATRKGEPSS